MLFQREKTFLQKVQWIAEKMHAENKIYFYESCSMEVLVNALELFNDWGIIEIKEEQISSQRKNQLPSSSRDLLVSLSPQYQQESQLQQFVESISKFRKLPLGQINQPKLSLKKLLLSEFPVLAKL